MIMLKGSHKKSGFHSFTLSHFSKNHSGGGVKLTAPAFLRLKLLLSANFLRISCKTKHLFLVKKVVDRREKSIAANPEEEPITNNSKKNPINDKLKEKPMWMMG